MAQQSFPVLDLDWETCPNPSAPKRDVQAPPPTEPDSKAPRVDKSSYSRGDLEFPRRHAMSPLASYLIAVTTEQLRLAGDEPARGWPAYSVLYPEGNPTQVIHDPVFNSENFRNMAVDYGWVTDTAMDPSTSARKAA